MNQSDRGSYLGNQSSILRTTNEISLESEDDNPMKEGTHDIVTNLKV